MQPDDQEKELLSSYEEGEWESVDNPEVKESLVAYAAKSSIGKPLSS